MSQTSATAANGLTTDSKKTFREFLEDYLKETDILRSKHITVTLIAISLILLSIVTLILETDKDINAKYGTLLRLIDGVIVVIFSLEYIARIYVAAGTPPGVSSWKGVWKYVWSFYGLVDLAAILPFFIGLAFPGIQIGYLRIFRLVRILMLGRYFKSFPLLRRAVSDKKGEILISLQVVATLTVILSVLMYEIEHTAQPDKFSDITTTLGWSVSKYIHDIAGTGDFKPQTASGKFLATIIGFLGIALFAIPAGLVASGFVDEMQEEKKRKDIEKKRIRIKNAFRKIPNEQLGPKKEVPRKYITMVQAKSRLNLSEQDIITIAELHKGVRLRYKRVNKSDVYPSSLLIEHYENNRSYGTCHPREKRSVTVISPNSYNETSLGHFSLCLAEVLEATFISNEIFGREDGVDPDTACSFSHNEAYYNGATCRSELAEFKNDIKEYVRPGALAIIVRSKESLPKGGSPEATVGNRLFAQISSHGVMGPDGLFHLRECISKIAVPLTDNTKVPDPIVAEILARGLNDLHSYVQQATHANVISIYVDSEVLEWTELDSYYRTIKSVADCIESHLIRKYAPITVLANSIGVNGNQWASSPN